VGCYLSLDYALKILGHCDLEPPKYVFGNLTDRIEPPVIVPKGDLYSEEQEIRKINGVPKATRLRALRKVAVSCR
jgi:hypothetical protein